MGRDRTVESTFGIRCIPLTEPDNVWVNRARTKNLVYKKRVFEGSGSTLGYSPDLTLAQGLFTFGRLPDDMVPVRFDS